MNTNEELKTRPDFPEWIKTKSGMDCNNFSNLKEQKYLTNRLAWAFDAGRDCIWDQYLAIKKEREFLQSENQKLRDLLKDAHETLIIASLIDKSNTCRDSAARIDAFLKTKTNP